MKWTNSTFTSNDFENLSNNNSAKNVYKTNPDICSMYNDSIYGMVKRLYKEQKKIKQYDRNNSSNDSKCNSNV